MTEATGFPRQSAAASLKPAYSVGDLILETGFPRQSAAASLKLHHADLVSGCAVTFSAAISRGLIEARRPMRSPYLVMAVFRGNQPRPH